MVIRERRQSGKLEPSAGSVFWRRAADPPRVGNQRHVGHGHDVSIGIARGISESEELLEVGVGKTGRYLQFTADRVVEHLAAAHQAAREGPLSIGGASGELG